MWRSGKAGLESGHHDYRMLPVAVAVWLTCLLPAVQEWDCWVWLLCGVLLLAVGSLCLCSLLRRQRLAGLFVAICTACLCAVLSVSLNQAVVRGDPATVGEQVAEIGLIFRVTGPAVASTVRGQDCQYPAVAQTVRHDGMLMPSGRALTVFGTGSVCAVVESGLYWANGSLQPSAFDQQETWFTVSDSRDGERDKTDKAGSFRQIQPAAWGFQRLHQLRQAFLIVCQRLGEQGRVLVPGVTLGVLGQQTLVADAGDDQAAGSLIKSDFRRSGIIHLLAVSGGHFVLLVELLRRLTARLRLPRLPTAALLILGQAGLALLMYPSDSVLRAFVMGVFSALALARGRPPQAMSALCWTVIFCLLWQPGLAASYGFALSCAAVLGILLWAGPLNRFLARRLPAWLSLSLALTLTAQALTLPVQVLMSPQLPLWALAANLCVAPVVSLATLCGLAALLVCWAQPDLGFGLVWLASLGTSLMNRCAHFFAGLGGGVFSLPVSGLPAALTVLLTECVIALTVRGLARRLTGHRARSPTMSEDSATLET